MQTFFFFFLSNLTDVKEGFDVLKKSSDDRRNRESLACAVLVSYMHKAKRERKESETRQEKKSFESYVGRINAGINGGLTRPHNTHTHYVEYRRDRNFVEK